MSRAITSAAALLLLIAAVVRYALPIEDGDLFWHLAHARQMLAGRTLIPDIALYSWTPVQTATLYCTWLADLWLYALRQTGGWGALFAFRYLVILFLLALAVRYAHQRGILRHPSTPLALLLTLLTSTGGAFLKPEIFSLLLFHLTVFLFYTWRHTHDPRPLYAIPALMLVWVNSHGGFILAAPFFLATALGEVRQPRSRYRHLLAAWTLSAAATAFTPYGPAYIRQLIGDYLFQQTARPDAAWNAAHQTIFHPQARGLYYPELLAGMALLTALTLFQTRRLDPTSLLLQAFYLPFFLLILRATFFLPAVWLYAFLSAPPPQLPRRHWQPVLNTAAFLLLTAFTLYDSWRHPRFNSWLGFGIGDVNPVREAEFLASHNFPTRLYNTFNNGGYLLWRLHPKHQVMVDSRSFPYLDWIREENAFERGENLAAFTAARPADVAVINYLSRPTWAWFLASPHWRPVFYGPAAAVFLKRSVPYTQPLRASIENLQSATSVTAAFDFASAAGDYPNTWAILRQMQTRFRYQLQPNVLARAEAYRDGHQALRDGHWRRAHTLFQTAFQQRTPGDRDRLITVFLHNLNALPPSGRETETHTYQAALRKLAAPE